MDQTQTGKKFYQKKRYWALGAVLLLFVIALSGSSSENKQSSNTNTEPTAAYVFDVPSLLNKNIDDVQKELGTPTHEVLPTEAQLKTGAWEWDKEWDKGSNSLLITYDHDTRKIIDIFIGANTDEETKNFRETKNILKAGNLSNTDSSYSVEFVKALKGGGYTGAIVRPK